MLKRFKKKHGKYIEEPRVKTEIVVVGEVVHEPPEEEDGVGGGGGGCARRCRWGWCGGRLCRLYICKHTSGNRRCSVLRWEEMREGEDELRR